MRRPLSCCVATNAVTVFDLKQGDCWPLVITSRVEIYGHPPMNRTTIEKSGNKLLVAQYFMQIFFLLLLCGTLRVKQEIRDDIVYYLIACGSQNRLNDLLFLYLIL
jgi:hypothetical protein